jgi:thiamine-phosphate pyrophosphorylase
MNNPIYFISQDINGYPHSDQIEDVCSAGIRMVQFRSKKLTIEQQINEGKAIREICTKYQCYFIVNDSVEVALACKADGVHLGSDDISIHEARKLLGNEKIIGYACSTMSEVNSIIKEDIDYLSIGPFKHTETKENIGALLGIQGYETIFNQLEDELPFPVFAVGGITLDDVEAIAKLPFTGIAMSNTIIKHNFKNLLVNHIKERFAQGKRIVEEL